MYLRDAIELAEFITPSLFKARKSPKHKNHFYRFSGNSWTEVRSEDCQSVVPLSETLNEKLKLFYFGNPSRYSETTFFSSPNGLEFGYLNGEGLRHSYIGGLPIIFTGAKLSLFMELRGGVPDRFYQAFEKLDSIFKSLKNKSQLESLSKFVDNITPDNIDYVKRIRFQPTFRTGDYLTFRQSPEGLRFEVYEGVCRRFVKTKKKIISPWTNEVKVTSTSSGSLSNSGYLDFDAFKKAVEDTGGDKVYRIKTILKPQSEPINWQRGQINNVYPPLPLVEGDKPIRKTSKNPNVGIFLMQGVELEFNAGESQERDQLYNFDGHRELLRKVTGSWPIVAMRDGSISGCEFIGPPGTLGAQKIMWNGVLDIMSSYKFPKVADNTGLHVHVSRQVFTPLILTKVLQFVNDPENNAFVDNIAGRPSVRHTAKFIAPKMGGNLFNLERNSAVNIVSKNTVEFRLFKATLDYETLAMRLEFVDAIIRWMYEKSPPLRKLKVISFIDFVHRNARHRYPELSNHLKREFV